jgi:DNA-binding transcriptional ArsR family regulator
MNFKKALAQKTKRLKIELECAEDQYPVIGIRSRVKFKDWVMLYQLPSEDLAKDKRIGGAEYRVLHFLLARMGYEGSVQISQGEIGEVLDMKQSNIGRSIKVLREAGIIRSEGKIGQTATYTINPYYGTRGKAGNVVQMQRKWNDNAE